MLNDYTSRLADLRRQFNQLGQIAHDANEPDLATRVDAAAQRMARRRFQIAVVGEFKAGKSTLINSLICEEVLPVETKECTAVVCHVRSVRPDEQHGATLVLANGEHRDVPIAEACQHLTIAKAMFHGQVVEEAEIRVGGAAWLGSEVEIVDTPGVNAAGLAREKATLSYLPNADAIVFITRADQLLNDDELTFLKERIVSRDITRVFVVINFADRLKTDRDKSDVRERARRLLEPITGSSRSFLTSARDAREALQDHEPALLEASGVPSLQHSLQDFITNERAAVELVRFNTIFEAHVRALQSCLSQRLEVSTFDRDTANRRRERLMALIKLAQDEGANAEQVALRELESVRKEKIESLISKAGKRMAAELDALNAKSTKISEGDASDIADKVGGSALASIQGCLRNEVSNIQRGIATRMTALFGKVDSLQGGNTDVHMRQLDYGSIVQIHSAQVQESEQELQSRNDAIADVAINAGVGAILGGLIGGLLFGPIGYYAGAAIGAGAGGKSTMEQKSVYRTVMKWVSHSKVKKDETVRNFIQALESGVADALRSVRERTRSDINTIVRAKTAELHSRREECDQQEAGTYSVDTSQIKSLLARVSALQETARVVPEAPHYRPALKSMDSLAQNPVTEQKA